MKPRFHRSLPRTLVICVAPLLACAPAHAGVVATNESNGSGVWTLPPGTNLLAGTAPTSAAASHEGSSASWGTLTDGSLGDVAGSPATSVTPNNGNTVTFPLDLTSKPEGYNITSFDSYCTWGNKDRDNQNYMLQYSTVANPTTFINIATVGYHTGSDRSTHTRLTDDTGFLATGVHSIRVIFDRQENGYVGYREFVLQDAPVTVCVSNTSRDNNTWLPLVGPNLLNGATATPASVVTHESSSASWTTLTDGILGTTDTAGNTQSVTPNNGNTVTFPLDLVAKPEGYDITSFESYCAWGSNGRDDQRYTLEYSTVAAPTSFLPITEVYNHTEFNGPNSRKSTRTRVTANTGGPMATGVAAIRVTFHDQENGYTGFREFILRDTPLPRTVTNESNNTHVWTLPAGTNLLNTTLDKTPAFAANSNHGNNDITNMDWTVLTNGSIGSAGVQMDSVAPLNNTSVVFPLDTSANTKGYNITSFDTYCAWGDSGRDDQNYTVSYSTVEDPGTFIPIEYVYNPTLPPNNSTHTRITAATGVLATHVGAVKFDFANQENGYVGYREFIALGTAVPLFSPLTWSGLDGSAGNANWIAGADNNWKDEAGSSPYNSLAPLTFDNTGINTSINLPSALTAASLSFSNDNTHPYQFSGELLTVTNGLDKSGAGSVTFANSVQAAGLTVSGTGTLTLSAANTLTGSSTVNNGTLNLANDAGLGVSSLAVTGGTVNFTSASPVVSSIAGTGGAIVLGNPAGAGTDTTLTVGFSDTATSSTYSGSIADASATANGSLTKDGTGTLTLTGTNSYTGTTTVFNGELTLGKRLSLYNGNTASWTASNILVFSNLTLRMGGAGEFTSSDVSALNTGGFDSSAILGLDTTSGDAEISDSLGGGVMIEKEGPNALTLSGSNTFSNGITLNQGTLNAANPAGHSISSDWTMGNVTFHVYGNTLYDNQFAPGALIKFNTGNGGVSGRIQLRGTNQTVAGLESGTGNRVAIIQNDESTTPGYTTNPGPCSLTIDTPEGSSHSFHGILRNQDGGSLSIIKKGAGTQEIINAAVQGHSYNGATIVENGTFRINFAGGNTGFGSNITVDAPATLNFRANGGNYAFDRVISGEGNVVVDGVNAVILTNGGNSLTGGITVDGGFLALSPNTVTGEGTGPGQTCVAGAMDPINVLTVNNGGTLSLDNTAALGNSFMLPEYAPSIVINEGSRIYGGTNSVVFVPNLKLNGGYIEVAGGANTGGFGTNITLVGTVVVGGTSTVPSTVFTNANYLVDGPTPSANANVSLGSYGLPGTTFQVADVTSSPAPDLTISSILRNVKELTSPLVKTGPGTMALEGVNTYTGDTTVSAGELIVSGGLAIPDTNKVVLDGGKLGLAADETVGTLYFGAVQQIAGTYGSTGSAAMYKDDSRFSGTAVLTVTTGPVTDPYVLWAAVITNPDDRDKTDDPDSDGFTNLDEFLFGTSPIANNGEISTVEQSGTNLIVRWCQRVSGGTYVLQESATLENPWPTSPVVPTDAADQTGLYSVDYVRKEAVIPIDSARKFARVEASE